MKKRIFQQQYRKQVKMYISLFLFHDLFSLEFVFTYDISLRKEYVTRTFFKFSPMKNIFRKLIANASLIMACLQIYRELLSLSEFIQTQKRYPTCIDKVVTLTRKLLVISR